MPAIHSNQLQGWVDVLKTGSREAVANLALTMAHYVPQLQDDECERSNRVTMDRLINHATDAIEADYFELYRNDEVADDNLHEMIDGLVPVYNHDRAALLAQDSSLAFPEDYTGEEGETDVYDILAWAIYQKVEEAAREYLAHLSESWARVTKAHGGIPVDAILSREQADAFGEFHGWDALALYDIDSDPREDAVCYQETLDSLDMLEDDESEDDILDDPRQIMAQGRAMAYKAEVS